MYPTVFALATALPHRFEQRDDGRHRDVKGVGLAGHRNPDEHIRFFQPKFTQPVLFAAHYDGERPTEVGLRINVGCVWRGRGSPNAFFPQPHVHGFGIGNNHRHGKKYSGRGAHHVGIKDIGDRIAHDDRVDSGRIGAAQDRAEVTGFLDRFHHEQERRGFQGKIRQSAPPLGRDGQQAIRTFAIGDFCKGVFRKFKKLRTGLPRLLNQGGFIFAQKPIGAEIQFVESDIFLQSPADLAISFHQKEARFVTIPAIAEFDELFDAWVLQAGDFFGERHSPETREKHER